MLVAHFSPAFCRQDIELDMDLISYIVSMAFHPHQGNPQSMADDLVEFLGSQTQVGHSPERDTCGAPHS